MSIKVTCSCGKEYKLRDEHAGRTATCKLCGAKFVIPSIAQTTSPKQAQESSAAETDKMNTVSATTAGKSKTSKMLIAFLIIIGVAGLIAGAILLRQSFERDAKTKKVVAEARRMIENAKDKLAANQFDAAAELYGQANKLCYSPDINSAEVAKLQQEAARGKDNIKEEKARLLREKKEREKKAVAEACRIIKKAKSCRAANKLDDAYTLYGQANAICSAPDINSEDAAKIRRETIAARYSIKEEQDHLLREQREKAEARRKQQQLAAERENARKRAEQERQRIKNLTHTLKGHCYVVNKLQEVITIKNAEVGLFKVTNKNKALLNNMKAGLNMMDLSLKIVDVKMKKVRTLEKNYQVMIETGRFSARTLGDNVAQRQKCLDESREYVEKGAKGAAYFKENKEALFELTKSELTKSALSSKDGMPERMVHTVKTDLWGEFSLPGLKKGEYCCYLETKLGKQTLTWMLDVQIPSGKLVLNNDNIRAILEWSNE